MGNDRIQLTMKNMIEKDSYEKLLSQVYTNDAGAEAARLAISIKQTQETIKASSKYSKSLIGATLILAFVTFLLFISSILQICC